MIRLSKSIILGAALVTLSASAGQADHHGKKGMAAMDHSSHMALEKALQSDIRKDDKARDQFRHPMETLQFFQVKPGMTVIDMMPSSGWYTRVLVPYLGENGKYVGLNPNVSGLPARFQENLGNLGTSFPAKAAEWTGVAAERIVALNSGDESAKAMKGQVDRALIFREIHNLYRWNILDAELKSIREMLKDDGMLGIVQHRAKANAPYSYGDGNKGYLREADVIKMVETMGFELVGKSEVNANAKDTADYESGVWTLPPVYGTSKDKPEEKAKYEAIGESDRMTLLFKKRP